MMKSKEGFPVFFAEKGVRFIYNELGVRPAE